jgi:N-acetylglucosamine-6-sulfatase
MATRTQTRLSLGVLGLAAALALAISAGTPAPANARPSVAPNIVVFQADDQTSTQFNRKVMPNTHELLVDKGTSFTNYIASTAQCCPSRATLITGQYAHNHGVTSNQVGYTGLVDKGNVLPVWLEEAGYRTIHVGKFMNGYDRFAKPDTEVAPGWEQWRSVLSEAAYYDYDYMVNGRVIHHGRSRDDHLTNVLNDDAVRMVRRYAPRRKPFYLQLDQRAPHSSQGRDPHGSCGRAAIPMPKDERTFKDEPLPKTRSFNERNMRDKPRFLRAAPRLDKKDRQSIRHRWRCALESIVGIDRGVEKVVKAVKRAGDLGRTVFIYVSDNGQFYGEHRMRVGKVLPYQEALQLPLVVRVPKQYRRGAVQVARTAKPVANIDLAPTILDLGGATPCKPGEGCRTMDGRSLLPILKRKGQWPRKRDVLTEYRVPEVPKYSTCEFAGIRTRHQIYVEHYRVANPNTGQCVDKAPPEVERYDLRSDPFELQNLCNKGMLARCPTGRHQLDLERRLLELRNCAGIKGRDKPVAGRPFCD